jgi:glycerol-3-phosphate dehydrogenase subunit B
MRAPETLRCDLMIIGTGMAGMSAAVFAAARGLSVVQAGQTGEIIFSSGLIDLMGIYPLRERREWNDPWAAIRTLCRERPEHPYGKLKQEEIRQAMTEMFQFLAEAGAPYYWREDRNCRVLTPVGTTKMTYGVPATMAAGVHALENRAPCLILDVHGLRGFNARQIVSVLSDRWPGIATDTVDFPGIPRGRDLFTEQMARSLESFENRQRFAEEIAKKRNNADLIGLPAICGIQRTAEVISDLEETAGVHLFEIPAMPPSATGIRIREAFLRGVPAAGVQLFPQSKVFRVASLPPKRFEVFMGKEGIEKIVEADGILLATGRFLGGGLAADRKRIRETILDLPVRQPDTRNSWHRKDFLDWRGHPINAAGLAVDDHFRPLAENGAPAFENLYAAGSILANQDWMRSKSGSGLAISTAFGAVRSFLCRA